MNLKMTNAIAAALSFFIFGLGLFLGAGVRRLLLEAVSRQPELIGSLLTRIFSLYNRLSLVLGVICVVLDALSPTSSVLMGVTIGLTATLALKLPIDSLIDRRERLGQVRGVGSEGRTLDRLHRVVEVATIVVLALAAAAFVLSLAEQRVLR
jgi:hypothetical protein